MKLSALNIVRHNPEIISPEILLVWSFSRSQLSAKYGMRDIKQPFFFPSLLLMFVDLSCL